MNFTPLLANLLVNPAVGKFTNKWRDSFTNMKLTDLQCRKASAPHTAVKLADGGGLYLHVCPNGKKLWRLAYRYAGKQRAMPFGPYPHIDIFGLQDKIAEGIVGAIARHVEHAEIGRASLKPTESLDAYDHYLRGMADFHTGGRDGVDGALSYFRRAITLDRSYASAYAMAAFSLYSQGLNTWMADSAVGVEEGTSLSRRAIALGKSDAIALARGGHALAHFTRDPDVGIDCLEAALALNPNFAAAWHLSGFLRIFRSEPEDAIDRFGHAIRLSPFDPEMFRMQTGVAMAHLIAGRFEEATLWATKACRITSALVLPGVVLAVSHQGGGRSEDAARAMGSVRNAHSALTRTHLERWLPFQKAKDAELFFEAVTQTGLPE